jgi:hypothetical protein
MTMKSLSLFITAILALTLLPNCGSGPGHIDARNPSISQMDELDVQWGLPRRTSRGTPKRLYPTLPGETAVGASASAAPVSAAAPSAAPAATSAPAPAVQPQAPVTVDPSVINKLR